MNQTLQARQTQAQTIRKKTSFTRREGATRAVQATALTMIQNTLIRTQNQTKARTTPAIQSKQTRTKHQNEQTRAKHLTKVGTTPAQTTLLQLPTMS